jgi:hypothetical protein
MLHQATPQPPPPQQTQHITLFQQAPSNQTQQSVTTSQATETEYRILIPPQHNGQHTQLALLHHETVKSKKPGDILDHSKLEILDTMTKLLPDINIPTTSNSFPTSFVFPAPQSAPPITQQQQPPQLQYFYEQLTGVQIAPQTPIAAVAPPPVVETGRRSQVRAKYINIYFLFNYVVLITK